MGWYGGYVKRAAGTKTKEEKKMVIYYSTGIWWTSPPTTGKFRTTEPRSSLLAGPTGYINSFILPRFGVE